MQVLAQDLERQYPRDNQGRRVKLTSITEAALPPRNRETIWHAAESGAADRLVAGAADRLRQRSQPPVGARRGACLQRDYGAGGPGGHPRTPLVRQLLTESTVLALVGGVAGLAVARWARDLLWSLRPPMFSFAAVHLDLDGRVLAYSLGVSLATGVIFGLVPALRATRGDLASDLKERTGRGSASGGWQPRRALVMDPGGPFGGGPGGQPVPAQP